MSSYIRKVLLPDEQIIYTASLHWIIYVPGIFTALICGILGQSSYKITSRFFDPSFAHFAGKVLAGMCFFGTMLGLFLLLGSLVRQGATELVITNRRVIAKYGFISRATFEILISRITGANFDQTIMGRIFGYGTILVHGAGGEISPIDVVDHPQMFHRALVDSIEHARTEATTLKVIYPQVGR